MKLPVFCLKCSIEYGSSITEMTTVVEIRDDGRYVTTCPRRHQSITILQEQKFEVLFEIGASAVIDGYYREAVSSFTSSLERFYEFAIRSISLDRGLQPKTVDQIWKSVAAQSERQLGAFIFLFASDDREPPLLNRKQVAFRNDVIHKGTIPARDEAIKYGQAVLDLIRPTMKVIKEEYPKGVKRAVSQHLWKCSQGSPTSNMSIGTIVSLNISTPEHHTRTLEQAISDLEKGWSRQLVDKV